VDANGKVSIAAPSSGVALEVAGNVQAKSSSGGAEVGVDAAGNANASLTLYHGGQPRWSLQSVEANRFLISRFNSSGQLLGRVFTILNDSGKVGVGLGNGVDPTEMLEVAGNAKVSGALTAGSFNLAGAATLSGNLRIGASGTPDRVLDAKAGDIATGSIAGSVTGDIGATDAFGSQFAVFNDDSPDSPLRIAFSDKPSGAVTAQIESKHYATKGGYLSFKVREASGGADGALTERLFIDRDGIVKINGRTAFNASGQALYA